MSKPTIHTPHDKLFTRCMTRKEAALDFLKAHASHALLKQVDLTTLDLKPSTFVSRANKELRGDIIYGIQTKQGPSYIYYSLEHQTQEDKTMPIRLLEYTVQIMHLHLKQQIKAKKEGRPADFRLPEVYCLVFYTGEKPYAGPKCLDDAFANAGALGRIGQHHFLIELAEISNAKLYTHGQATLMELTLKHGKDPCKLFKKERARLVALINTSKDLDKAQY